MKFSETWLREWVNPNISTEVLLEQLTNAGLEVDTAEPVAHDFSKVVVAEILSVDNHPEADRLRVCQVNVGQAHPIQIVTNVADVKAGMKLPCALVGAKLPELDIKAAKLRGVESQGMFGGHETLGVGDASEGLVILPKDATVGQDIREYLQLNDVAIDIELTPNRADCLSIAGVAREVGVANQCALNIIEPQTVKSTIDDDFPVKIKANKACPRYLGRVIRNVNVDAVTPVWIRERLRRSGIRCVDPVVDVTNYVMLEIGQPMHAFDLDKLQHGIIVRYAKNKETLTLLNEQTIDLSDDVLVIADKQGPIALAGAMGGLATSVTDETANIFLEIAFFDPNVIMGKARRFGLHTDGSHRFERGVDPTLQMKAMNRATQLILDIVGGDAGPVTEVVDQQSLPKREAILLRQQRIPKVLGCEVAAEQVMDILQRLGMHVDAHAEGWMVTPPPQRFDMSIEEDLIEEVARVFGYNNIPTRMPTTILNMLPQPSDSIAAADFSNVLAARGYHEAICYSFVDAKSQSLLDPEHEALALTHPISPELAVMRTNLSVSLLRTLIYNLKRQQERVRLFEAGLRFVPSKKSLQQIPTLAGLVSGDALPEQWGEAARSVDYYDVKADVEALLELSGESYTFVSGTVPMLHPGQTALIMRKNEQIGYMGRLHPSIQQQLKLPHPIYLFELDFAKLQQTHIPAYQAVAKFPMIRRDLALVVDDNVSAGDILSTIRDIAGKHLKKMVIFDVYKGDGIADNHKSLALGLILQDQQRTLVDEDVNTLIDMILATLKQRFNATLRD